MMTENDTVVDEDTQIFAVLDTGCNNTCHGDRWMKRYAEIHGTMPVPEEAEGKFRGVGGKVMVSCKRTIPMCMKSLDNELLPGTIVSIELENSDAPLLLSATAQQKLGLVVDMGNGTIYSRTLDKELDMVMHNGLPSIALYPGQEGLGNIVLSAMDDHYNDGSLDTTDASEINDLSDINDTSGTFDASDDDVIVTYEDVVPKVNTDGSDTGGGKYIPIQSENVKILSRKQRKHLQESLDDVEKEDCALWSSLGTEMKRPRKMLPRGCKSFLMEILAGAATLSCLAVGMGLSISQPIDIIYDDRFNLLKPANREALEKMIEEEDPYLLTIAPLCGPWSSWQYVNMSKSEETRDKINQQRREWYPVPLRSAKAKN